MLRWPQRKEQCLNGLMPCRKHCNNVPESRTHQFGLKRPTRFIHLKSSSEQKHLSLFSTAQTNNVHELFEKLQPCGLVMQSCTSDSKSVSKLSFMP